MDNQAPTATLTGDLASPRNSRVGVVTARFSEAVAGVDLADFTLTRNSVNVPLTGLIVTMLDDFNYSIDLPR